MWEIENPCCSTFFLELESKKIDVTIPIISLRNKRGHVRSHLTLDSENVVLCYSSRA